MSPDDSRHGSLAGYRAGCRERCCKEGINRYHKTRDLKQLRGQPLTSLRPALGTQRRLQALMALGWSLARLEEHTGIDRTYLRVVVRSNRRVSLATADRIAKAYDALCMTLPPTSNAQERQGATRTLRLASQRGYVPPLAWDDIDNDTEPATGESVRGYVDQAVVDRFFNSVSADELHALAGESTTATRHAITDAWLEAGRTWNALERITGWQHGRYGRTRRTSRQEDAA